MTPTNTETINVMNSLAEYAADFWSRHHAPMPYERVVLKNGRRVRVLVEEELDRVEGAMRLYAEERERE